MASKTLLTPQQYLATSWEREPEYVRGELVERPLPNKTHGRLQLLLCILLGRAGFGCTEVRMRIAGDVYRVPDFALFENEPPGEIPDTPPLLIIEIASPDDRFADLMAKLNEYRRWGVKHLWLIEPGLKELRVYEEGSVKLVDRFEIPEFGLAIERTDLFV